MKWLWLIGCIAWISGNNANQVKPLKQKYQYYEHLSLTTTSTVSDDVSAFAYSSPSFRNTRVIAKYEFTLAMFPTPEALSSSSNALLELFATHPEYRHLLEMHLVFTTGRHHLRNGLGNGVMLRTLERGPFPWKKLVNDLSGVFCASLNMLDTTTLATPKWTFAPTPGLYNSTDFQVKYAVLPKESQCTENLTPWLKLLPCRNRAGLAAMLDPYKIYNSDFIEMGIHVYRDCSKSQDGLCHLKVVQSLECVMDPLRMTGHKDWKLASFHPIHEDVPVCPLTTSTTDIVLRVEKTRDFTWNVVPHSTDDQGSAIYTLEDLNLWKGVLGNVGVSFNKDLPPNKGLVQPRLDLFSVHRYSTGYGQEYGGISLNLINRHDQDVQVTLFQMIPWYLNVYLSTLDISSHPLIYSFDQEPLNMDIKDVIVDMYYQPSLPRVRPSVMEAQVIVPKQTRLDIRIQFDKSFIKYTEHPPDANRGFDIGPAIITLPQGQVLWTSNLLINLPTPDFSMPYNVITLTCTVLALLVGSIFNLMMRDVKPIGDEVK